MKEEDYKTLSMHVSQGDTQTASPFNSNVIFITHWFSYFSVIVGVKDHRKLNQAS